MKSQQKLKIKNKKVGARQLFSSAFTSQTSIVPVISGKPSGLSIRNYDAARTGRRLGTWLPGSPGPTSGVQADLQLLRDRSLDQVKNNAWINSAITSIVANEIGTGITLHSASSNKTFRLDADKLMKRWIKVSDSEEVNNLYGQMAMACWNRRVFGEVFLRKRLRDFLSPLPIPLKIEMLHPAFCPFTYNDLQAKIKAGIQLNGINERTAYWMYQSHPLETDFQGGIFDLVAVPADSVIHHYKPRQPGELRGVPDTVSSLIRAKIFDAYEDAELNRKLNKSSYTGFISQKSFPDEEGWKYNPVTGEPLERDTAGLPVMNVEPGSFILGYPGEEPTLFEGDSSGQGFADFMREPKLGMAAGLNIPYEIMTGDMRELNDRLLRFIANEFHRVLEQEQWLTDIPQICEKIWEWAIDTAVLSGRLNAPGYADNREDYIAVDCRPEGWAYLHPVQDVEAKLKAIAGGLSSQTKELTEMGEDSEEMDEQNRVDKERQKEKGLSYDLGVKASSPTLVADPQNPDGGVGGNP